MYFLMRSINKMMVKIHLVFYVLIYTLLNNSVNKLFLLSCYKIFDFLWSFKLIKTSFLRVLINKKKIINIINGPEEIKSSNFLKLVPSRSPTSLCGNFLIDAGTAYKLRHTEDLINKL